MRDTFLRPIIDDERNFLYNMIDQDNEESSYRAKILLLKDEGYTIPEIRVATKRHDTNIRKWIHRFNEKGIEGIISRKHVHKPSKKNSRNREKDCKYGNQKSTRSMDYPSQHGRYVFLQDTSPRN